MTRRPDSLAVARLLGVCALLGVLIALGFIGFEALLHRGQHYLWVTVIGHDPSNFSVISLAAVGGLALGLMLMLVPGHGGAHPADGHNILAGDDDAKIPVLLGILVVGLVGLCFGASLGPEGAVLPVAAGISVLLARWLRIPGPMGPLVKAAGLGALLAAMFGSPLAGLVPLMELIPSAALSSMAMLVLPSLTAGATAVLTLQVMDEVPIGRLPLDYIQFRPIHLVWAVVVGIVAGGAGLAVDRAIHLMRPITRRIDARSITLTTTLGGLVLGTLYVLGGEKVRFAGIPELLSLIDDEQQLWPVVAAIAIKVAATGLCLAAGYRGGKIFPVAFIGGATGLALHLAVTSIPLPVAVGVGLAASMATALGAPATAAIIAASLVSPALLPLALIGVVSAHAVHLLGGQLATAQPLAAATAEPPSPALDP